MKRKLLEQDIDKIKTEYLNGTPSKEVCKIFDIHYTTLQKIISKNKIVLDRTIGEEKRQLILELYQKGVSSIKIATQLKISKPSVLRTLQANNISRKKRADYNKGKKLPPVSKEELYSLYIEQRQRASIIGTIFNKHQATIRKWLDFYEIPRRTSSEEHKLIPCYEHSCWKGGVTPLRNLLFNRLADWKQSIRDRDERLCQRCKDQRGWEVHHLKPLRVFISEFLIEFPQINLDNPIDLEFACKIIVSRHSLEHGIFLCQTCHCEVDAYRRVFKTKESKKKIE